MNKFSLTSNTNKQIKTTIKKNQLEKNIFHVSGEFCSGSFENCTDPKAACCGEPGDPLKSGRSVFTWRR